MHTLRSSSKKVPTRVRNVARSQLQREAAANCLHSYKLVAQRPAVLGPAAIKDGMVLLLQTHRCVVCAKPVNVKKEVAVV